MPRKLPALTPDNRPFWQGGEQGVLRMHRCANCSRWFHPPAPVCPHCGSLDVAAQPVSGRGRVATFTVNHQAWTPELAQPYVVAIVELDEQPGLRFVTNIVGCAPDDVHIGLPVQVRFERVEDVWLPLFAPLFEKAAS
jgi:uncharacterized OB-fold protein